MTVVEAARKYIARGWMPVPVPLGEKGVVLDGWPALRIGLDQVDEYFGSRSNIGLLTGEASGGLVDVDLDCDEAAALAEAFLPATPMWSGRRHRPRSHAWYRVTGREPQNVTVKDIDKRLIGSISRRPGVGVR